MDKDEIQSIIGDIGGVDIADIDFDINMLDFLNADEVEETRYTMPKIVHMPSDYVMYDNAVRLAKDLRIDFGQRADCFVSGNFIFGDFIEAYLTEHDCTANRMTVSTLSMSQDNVDSFRNLIDNGYVEQLDLIVSVYFWFNERRSLIPYIYQQLDIGNRFQMAVAGIHTKTVSFETLGGRKIVIHGSANLRSNGNIEQFTIEENPGLYDFYESHYRSVIEKYATIRKPIRNANAWDVFSKRMFND